MKKRRKGGSVLGLGNNSNSTSSSREKVIVDQADFKKNSDPTQYFKLLSAWYIEKVMKRASRLVIFTCILFILVQGYLFLYPLSFSPQQRSSSHNFKAEDLQAGSATSASPEELQMNNRISRLLIRPSDRSQLFSAERVQAMQEVFRSLPIAVKELANFERHLRPHLLRARSIGSEGHRYVQSYLTKGKTVDFLMERGWTLHQNKFNVSVPIDVLKKTNPRLMAMGRNGQNVVSVPFNNILWRWEDPEATKNNNNNNASNPPPKHILLTAHYDSKSMLPEGSFIGATDSAFPCSLAIEIAVLFSELLPLLKRNQRKLLPGLTIIFFDGEEAFKDWSDSDSLYGSRHLASLLRSRQQPFNFGPSQVDLFILLDLLGAASSYQIPNFEGTQSHYNTLSQLETHLNYKTAMPPKNLIRAFTSSNNILPTGSIADDHIPFQRLNIPTLHVIAAPFPQEWHTVKDNGNALDPGVMAHFSELMKLFLLNLFTTR